MFSLFCTGDKEQHEEGVQVPRPVRLVHPENVPEKDAPVPRGREQAEGAFRRRRQGDRRQRRQKLHARRLDDQAAGQAGPGVFGEDARLLRQQQHDRVVRHAGPGVQRDLDRRGGLRHSVLQPGFPVGGRDQGGHVQLYVRLVLRGQVRQVSRAQKHQHLFVIRFFFL